MSGRMALLADDEYPVLYCTFCGRLMERRDSRVYPGIAWEACPRYTSLLNRMFGDGTKHDLEIVGYRKDRFDATTGERVR